MEYGLRAHDIPKYDDIEGLADELSRREIRHIQFAPRVSLAKQTDGGNKVSYGLATKVAKVLDDRNVKISVLGCYVNIIHPDEKERSDALKLFKKYLSVAKSFKAELVATETGSVDLSFHQTPANYTEKNITLAIQQVQKMVAEAEKLGVFVGIEPGINHPIYNIQQTVRLLKKVNSPNLKIIFDPMNLVMTVEDDELAIVREGIEVLGDDIYAFHIKDYQFVDGQKQVVPVGTGVAPLQEIIKAIRKSQPDPYIILDETPQEAFNRSLNLVQKMYTEEN